MGSIQIEELPCQSENGRQAESVHVVYNAFRSFSITGLASDETITAAPRTGMKEEILLLSWLIVLLRTREGSRVNYQWAYTRQGDEVENEEAVQKNLSMREVMNGLQNTVGEVAAETSRYLAAAAAAAAAAPIGPFPHDSCPISLLLSTSSLSKTSEEAKDEGILHLEIRLSNDTHLEIRPLWHTDNMLEHTVSQYISTLVDTITICISNPSISIEECIRPSDRDLDEIWSWNHDLPPFLDFCMHEVISQQSQKLGDKIAISSWDGDLTYAQIEEYSTHVAHSLKEMGVELHDVLPVCFEKSRWTIVAVLAVMKAGGTLAMMDATLPLARLQNMAKQVGAKAMLSSRMQIDLSTSISTNGKILIVEADTFANSSRSQTIPKLETVPSSALMYIIFTSGSTGTPKGVKISHGTYTSSAIPRAKAVGYTEESRVLDFASYAFDVSIDSMLLTLGNGGCLCIPSDEDRLNDINGVIRDMRVNYAGITPSVARILDADVIKSLSGLGLGGEAASARDVTLWGQDTRIIIGYGPCECTIGCTINSSAATGRDYISIGTGNGAAIWVADPNDHNSLMPVGAVGELLVEGPIVGQGYLNDPDKTAAAFIEDPPWLVTGHKAYGGRRGCLYKTGDLGKYDPDGSGGIIFAGRKDTQVKLRGQRVELGEIESQMKARLPSKATVIAEVIIPLGSGGQPTLVAFISSEAMNGQGSIDIGSAQLTAELRKALSTMDAELAEVLPRYMVPTAYIPVNGIPVLISGKSDRKRLREFGAKVDLRQIDQDQDATNTPNRQLNDREQQLRQAWSQTLKLDEQTIRLDDNFFALGGDSLTAMKLVSVCRAEGLELSVTGTFRHPTLSAMAGILHACTSQLQAEIPAFSMISQGMESARLEASQICGTELADIEDIYPCTPTQESLFTFSLKSVKVYVAQRVASIPSHISVDSWKKAWEDVVAAHPILCTRLAQLQEPGLQQVVLRENISWRQPTNLEDYLELDRKEKMELGQKLARYAIVDNSTGGDRYMVWTVHHVLYDGWSEPLILQQVNNALLKQRIESQVRMRDFVKYVRDTDEVAMQEFWRQELRDAVGPQFPRLPSRDYLPTPDSIIEHHIPLETSAGSNFTLATLIRGAWALVASQYTGNDDVVFGETLTGRDVSLAGVESIVGPLIATVPVRIRIDRTSSVESYLEIVQQSMVARTPYQHMGMQNIRKVSPDAQHACEAGTGLVIQPEAQHIGNELGFGQGDAAREALHFNPYPLMLACGIGKGGFRICASFDSSLIEVPQMERILAQLEMACFQLSKGLSRRIDEISCLPEVQLSQIWQWNQTPPLSFDKSSARIRADASIKQGSIYPRAVVPWVCDLRNPSLLSPIGCVGELWLEGALLSGESVESPPWLLAGSSASAGRTGRVQPTGDMVQLQQDGSLIFVGRKDNVVPVQGHALDIADLEAHFTRHLPPTVRAAAAVSHLTADTTQQGEKQDLIVFVEQQPFEEESIEIMPVNHDIITHNSSSQIFETKVHAAIPTSLAAALKKLDKFLRESLPSYMIPNAYVVIEKMPTETGQIDHNTLNQLASSVPQDVLNQLQEGFKMAWAKTSVHASLTVNEQILQSSWAKILGIKPEQIDPDDNFFRLGGDSVLAMKLVSSLRAQGHGLTVADIFQRMRLGDAAKVLKVNRVSKDKVQLYKAFSTLRNVDVESFLAEIVRPKLQDSSWSIQDVFPVTDSQALDIRATTQPLRTSVQYTMLYFDSGIDQRKVVQACNKLVETHDILRTVFIEHESTFFQVVIDKLAAPVITHQANGELEEYVTALCAAETELEFHLGSSFLRIFHVEGNDGKHCLVLGLSHAQYDGISLPMLLRDLETLFIGQKVDAVEPFSSYMAKICDERVQDEASAYWRELLDSSALSILQEAPVQPTDKSIFHTKSVDISQRPAEITTANLLTAAWALVLARRLQKPDVTFGSVTSGRNIEMANVDRVQGPCYQITPVRVKFEPQWTAMDLLQSVQKQSAESAAYDFLGAERISRQCTQWSSGSETRFLDSVVHHQDWEDFDAMPFAGTLCRVEILNPHGDAAHPSKIVSFVRDGQTCVGVVGNERDPTFVDANLDELAIAIQELATCGSGHVLLDDHIF